VFFVNELSKPYTGVSFRSGKQEGRKEGREGGRRGKGESEGLEPLSTLKFSVLMAS
jgi:hypothetical protein